MTGDYRIQPALWRLPAGTISRTYQTAAAPSAWIATFPRPDRSPPLVPLVTALRAVCPGIRHARAAQIRSGEPFLWAEDGSVPASDALSELVDEWVGVAFDDDHRQSVLNAVRQNPLVWQPQAAIDLAAWVPGPNGTAAPADPLQYPLLASHAAQILERFGIDVGNRHLDLLHIRQPDTNGGEVLISWPPEHEVAGAGRGRVDEYWCLQLEVSVATIAWDPEPRVRVDSSRRRFMSRPTSWVPPGMRRQRLSSLAHWPAERPLHFAGQPAKDCLVELPLRWKRAEHSRWDLEWFDKTGLLFARLDLDAGLDPSVLAANPLRYPPERAQPCMLLGTRNGIEPFTSVGHGFWQVDHRLLHDGISAALAHVGYLPDDPLPAPIRLALTDLPPARVRGRVEAWCQSGEAAAAVRAGIEAICGVPTEERPDGTLAYQDGHLCFERRSLPAIWASPVSVGEADTADAGGRATLVTESVAQPEIATIAIVELNPKSQYRRRPDADPYLPVKRGLIASGRAVQGLETPDPTDRKQAGINHRGQHAALDALRQLGAQFTVPDVLNPVQGGVRQVAIVPITRNNIRGRPGGDGVYPVALVVEPDGESHALAFGDHDPCELHELLCRFGLGLATSLNRDRSKATYQWSGFVDHVITQLRDGPPTLLILQRHNTWWRCLADKNLAIDHLPIPGAGSEPALCSYRPDQLANLRAVRVDLDWVRHAGFLRDGNVSPTHGLYQSGPRRFVSRGNKPLTRKLRENRSVFGSHTRRATRPVTIRGISYKAGDWVDEPREPFQDAWNPATSELTLFFLQPGDDPVKWATYIHAQRHLAVQYSDPLASPAILHNAHLVGNYLSLSADRDPPDRGMRR